MIWNHHLSAVELFGFIITQILINVFGDDPNYQMKFEHYSE
jgi:hypothetical protein